jgi:hypothetical protein
MPRAERRAQRRQRPDAPSSDMRFALKRPGTGRRPRHSSAAGSPNLQRRFAADGNPRCCGRVRRSRSHAHDDKEIGVEDAPTQAVPSKVPEVTLAFWVIKIAATTLGETGGDSVTMTLNAVADARYRARRLDGRYRRARLCRRRAGLRCGARRHRGALFLHLDLPRRAVLGGIHPHPAARRHGRRFSRQAAPRRWAGAEPPLRLRGDRRLHHHLSHGAAAARRRHPQAAA